MHEGKCSSVFSILLCDLEIVERREIIDLNDIDDGGVDSGDVISLIIHPKILDSTGRKYPL